MLHGVCVDMDCELENQSDKRSSQNSAGRHIPIGPSPGSSPRSAWGTFSANAKAALSEQNGLPRGVSISTAGFGVAAVEGRKRAARGGVSEDAFCAELQILGSSNTPDAREVEHSAPSTEPEFVEPALSKPRSISLDEKQETETGAEQSSNLHSFRIQAKEGRAFHLFAVFDGHRSHHAARFCAETLSTELTKRLRAVTGVQCALATSQESEAAPAVAREAAPSTGAASPQDPQKQAEEIEIKNAFSDAVQAVDDALCQRHWVSLVRNNGRRFYVTKAVEVDEDFDMESWNVLPFMTQFVHALDDLAEKHAVAAGLEGDAVRAYAHMHRSRWMCYKQALFPGCTLCAVLVDEERGTIYCANVGDSGALLFRPVSQCHSPRPVGVKSPHTASSVPCPGMQSVDAASDVVASESVEPPSSSADAELDSTSAESSHQAESREQESTNHTTAGTTPLSKVHGGHKVWGLAPDVDSLMKPGDVKLLNRVHKPSQPDELERVSSTPEGYVKVHGITVDKQNHEAVSGYVETAKAAGHKVSDGA